MAERADAAGACAVTDTASMGLALADINCNPINAAAGPYAGPFAVTRSVVINGANAGTSPNTGSRGAESVVTSGSDGFSLNSASIAVTVDGFTITPARFGVRELAPASSVSVFNNINTGGSGISLTQTVVGSTVSDNRVTTSSGNGIAISQAGAATASANVVRDTRSDGISMILVSGGAVAQGNTVDVARGSGISTIGVGGPTLISGNTVITSTAAAITSVFGGSASSAVTISSNTVRDTAAGSSGIDVVLPSGDTAVSANSIIHSQGEGISVVLASRPTSITGNSIRRSEQIGVDLALPVTSTISGNSVSSRVTAMSVVLATGAVDVTNNTVTSTMGIGIDVVIPNGATTVLGNSIANAGSTGIDVVAPSGPTFVSGNTILTAGGNGISAIASTKDVTVSGNSVADVGASGIASLFVSGTTSITQNRVDRANRNRGATNGGIAIDAFGSGSGPVSIRSNAVTNSFIGLNLTDTAAGVSANFNRIVDNSAAGIVNRSPRPDVINAENNWFGCNAGPGAAGCDTLSPTVPGTIDANPWLVLGISAGTPFAFTAASAGVVVTADLTKNSTGQDTSSLGFIPDGTPVTFTTTFGTATPASAGTVNGKASTTVSSPQEGTATVSATVDHQTVSIQVFIPRAIPGSRTFFFAEGTTLDGFREYLLLANAGPNAVDVAVTYFFDDGSTPQPTTVPVAAGARTTVDVVTVVGANRTGVSIGISAPAPIVAERSMFFEHDFPNGLVNGSHSVLGARLADVAWTFAEGSTLDGFQEYLTLQNPGSTAANVTILYGIEGAGSRTRTVGVPAGQRRTIDVNADIPGVVGHSTRVTSDKPILAERPMYFRRAVGDDGVLINGGHVAFGSAPATEWNFAEGNVLPDFAQYLTLGNPDPANPATANITYFFSDGTTAAKTATVAPESRRTVRVFDTADPAGVGRNVSDPVSRGVSTKVTTAAPAGLVVERPMYFHRVISSPGPEINDGHDKAGANALSQTWAFAEGSTLPGFYPFLTILNPSATAATVSITYTPDRGLPVVRTVTARPTSRLTVQVYADPAQGGIGGEVTGFGIIVGATQPVLVERPFYVDRVLPGLPEINGGSVVIGFPT